MYEDFYINKDMFDFCEYPDNSRFYNVKIKKVIGKMKDYIKVVVIVEFVGLKSNIYSRVKEDNEGDKKVKGINKDVVKNIMHEEYENTLFEKKQMRHNKERIQGKSHKEVDKVFLS